MRRAEVLHKPARSRRIGSLSLIVEFEPQVKWGFIREQV